MEKEAYGELSVWASDGIELMKKNNISLDDLQKILKIAYGMQTVFDVFWSTGNSQT